MKTSSIHHLMPAFVSFLIALSLLTVARPIYADTIYVGADKPVYDLGEVVTISGIVSSYTAYEQVGIQIFKPDGERWAIAQTEPTSEGRFSVSVARLAATDPLGVYNITAFYAGEKGSTFFLVGQAQRYSFSIIADGQSFDIIIFSNSGISEFSFEQDLKQISFTVTGQSGTDGFSSVSFSNNLLGGIFSVKIDESSADFGVSKNTTHTSINLKYIHGSQPEAIKITGTIVIPEFPGLQLSLVILAAVGLSSLLAFKASRSKPSKTLQ